MFAYWSSAALLIAIALKVAFERRHRIFSVLKDLRWSWRILRLISFNIFVPSAVSYWQIR